MFYLGQKIDYRITLVALFLLWTFAESVIASNTRGVSGMQSMRTAIAGDGSTNKIANYDLEMLPGQEFTGWYYFWLVSGESISASLREETDASWLSFSPTTFTSVSCDDITAVEFKFTAPQQPGVYTVNIIDENGNWQDVLITLYVTANPLSADSRLLEIPMNETTTRSEIIGWFGLSNFSCVDLYIPADTARFTYRLYPAADWLEITPPQVTFLYSKSGIIDKKFTISEAGIHDLYEVLEAQWYSAPRFIHWQVNVISSIDEDSEVNLPGTFSLDQNYPNPFNPSTTIRYQLAASTEINLSIYDLLGQKITTLISGPQTAGSHQLQWDASSMTSGIYYYRLVTANGFGQTKKLMVLK